MKGRKGNKDAPAPVKTADIWGGRKFGFIQYLHYVASTAGLVVYLIHFLSGRSLGERVTMHGTMELVLLLTRWMNEVSYGKWGAGDVFHHLTMVISYYLVFYVPSCAEFGWALCQMQILHVPMLLWYLGCRRGCYATHQYVMRLCCSWFPVAWIVSVSYRASIIVYVAYTSFVGDKTVATIAAVSFALVLGYLDINWTKYFFTELKWPAAVMYAKKEKSDEDNPNRQSSQLSTIKLGLAEGLYLAAIFSACMTVSLFASQKEI